MKELNLDSVVAIRLVDHIWDGNRIDESFYQVQVQTDDDFNWHCACVVETRTEAILTASALKMSIPDSRFIPIYNEHGYGLEAEEVL